MEDKSHREWFGTSGNRGGEERGGKEGGSILDTRRLVIHKSVL